MCSVWFFYFIDFQPVVGDQEHLDPDPPSTLIWNRLWIRILTDLMPAVFFCEYILLSLYSLSASYFGPEK